MKNSVSSFKVRHLLMFAILMLACLSSDAQYYYGAPPPPPRRQRPNQPPPEKQDEGPQKPTGYLSINYGLALPESNLAIAFGSAYGGYALPGSVFHFSLAFPINHSYFGIALMYGGYDNIYDINTYVNNLNSSNSSYSGYAAGTNSDNIYSESSIMGGLSFTYPIGRLSIDARLMVGALLCNFPEQDYFYADAQGNAYENDIQSSYSTGFAFDAGIGLRYLIVRFGGRPLCALLNADFLYSDPSYSTVQDQYITPASGSNAGVTLQVVPSPPVSGHLPISLLNITLGLGYQIGK